MATVYEAYWDRISISYPFFTNFLEIKILRPLV